MIEIRPFKSSDLENARKVISKGCGDPHWEFCHVVEQDGEIVGIIEISTMLTGDIHMKKGANGASLLTFGWFDGRMRTIANNLGFGGYEFFVSNEQPEEWRQFIGKHLPVGEPFEKPGKFYFRSFANGKIEQSEKS